MTKNSSSKSNYRPPTGEPGSTYVAPNGDSRTYGSDGKPVHDYDHSDHGHPKHHPHDENGGNHHDWTDGVRGDPYIPGMDCIIGIGIVGISVIGIVYIIGNDATGIGVADDFLIGPLGLGVKKGLVMVFQ